VINHILSAYKCALEAVKPELAVRAVVSLNRNTLTICNRSFDLDIIKKIYLVGAGKAVLGMAKPIFDLLGSRISDAALAAVEFGSDYSELSKYVHLASHPVPDEKSVGAALKILAIAERAQENDLVIVLISGGASSLMALPEANTTLSEKQRITEELLRSGAPIEEVNRQRKQLSAIKGGKLALAAFPANVISVIISDVKDDDISVIGSGPTVCHDESCLSKFANVTNHVVASNATALKAAAKYLETLGYEVYTEKAFASGEARQNAFWQHFCEFATGEFATNAPSKSGAATRKAVVHGLGSKNGCSGKPIACLGGGETGVTVRGGGKGGRCHEMALSALIESKRLEALNCDFAGAFLATDGIDGPTDSAGAFFDDKTLEKAEKMGLDPKEYLETNDSYSFFEKLGNTCKAGYTKTNVNDLYFALRKK